MSVTAPAVLDAALAVGTALFQLRAPIAMGGASVMFASVGLWGTLILLGSALPHSVTYMYILIA